MYGTDGPEELRPVGEVEFVQGLAAASASGLYGPCRAAAAIVGHANLNLGERVEPVLETLQAASPNRFRGIRHSVTWAGFGERAKRLDLAAKYANYANYYCAGLYLRPGISASNHPMSNSPFNLRNLRNLRPINIFYSRQL